MGQWGPVTRLVMLSLIFLIHSAATGDTTANTNNPTDATIITSEPPTKETQDGMEATTTINCQQMAPLNHGTITYINNSMTTYGSLARYTCDVGYEVNGPHTSICTDNGSWNVTSMCIVKDCGIMAPLNHGNITYKNNSMTTYGSLARYTCDVGYEVNGPHTSICTENGSWNVTSMCIIKDCGVMTPLNHGNITYIKNSMATYGSLARYTCDVGYEVNGPHTSICTENGSWNVTSMCIIKDCGVMTPLNHGNITYINNSMTTYGSLARYTCDVGYEVNGPHTSICTDNGSWNVTSMCIIKDCGAPVNISDGIVMVSGDGATVYEHTATYTCDIGFVLRNGSRDVTCDATGSWSKPTPECLDVNECEDKTICGSNAICNNTVPGYTCTCPPEYPKGNPFQQCYNKVLLDMSTKVTPVQGDNEVLDPHGLPKPFYYYGSPHDIFRPSMNGFISLDYEPIHSRQGPENATEWKDVTRSQVVLAPLWTNLDSRNISGGGLYWHILSDRSTDNIADLASIGRVIGSYYPIYNNTDFRPTIAVVATWLNVTIWSSRPAREHVKTQNASMQVIAASDGLYSYVMFNYDDEQWSLDPSEHVATSAGFSTKDKTGYIMANRYNFSELNKHSNVQPELNGRWLYNVTTISGAMWDEIHCQRYLNNDTRRHWLTEQLSHVEPCPCFSTDMLEAFTYGEVSSRFLETTLEEPRDIQCYQSYFFNKHGIKQRCCYNNENGELKTDYPYGGLAVFERDLANTSNGFDLCCSPTGTRRYCPDLYAMIPPDDCTRWVPEDQAFYEDVTRGVGKDVDGASSSGKLDWLVRGYLWSSHDDN